MTDLATLRARADDTAGLLLYARACLRAGEPCPEIMRPLRSVEAWDDAVPGVQDAAAAEVARRMGEGWRFDRMIWVGHGKESECRCCIEEDDVWLPSHDGEWCDLCLEPCGRKIRRIAVFEHEATGAEFSLCPGAVRTCPYPGMMNPCMRGHVPHEHVDVPPLLVARTPVTEDQIDRWFGLPARGWYLPFVGCQWDMVRVACEKMGLRLPTTTEWRHFAAAGTTTRFWWGDEMDGRYCWHAGNSGIDTGCRICIDAPSFCSAHPPRLHPVTEHDKTGLRSPFGLVDVWGGVWEFLAGGRVAGGAFDEQPTVIAFSDVDLSGSYRDSRGQHSIGFRPVADIGE